jgi:hypothetical protein
MGRSCIIASCLLILSVVWAPRNARAQTADALWIQNAVYPGYPGSILIAPQDSSFKAPGIYRSIEERKNIRNPVEVDQICAVDVAAMSKRHVFDAQRSDASGVSNARSYSFAVKVDVDVKVVKGDIAGNYDETITLSTGPVQVFSSTDDTIAATVLQNIKSKCRRVIRTHLDQNRLVFIAAKAIQAHDYDAEVMRKPSAQVAGSCWLGWCGASAEFTANLSNKTQTSAPNKFVTIALVPAQIENRFSLMSADVEPAPASRRHASQFANETRPPSAPLVRTASWSWEGGQDGLETRHVPPVRGNPISMRRRFDGEYASATWR